MNSYEPYLIEDVKKSSSRELFTVVSTFAGGGGSSTGYRLAGGKVIAINEFVEEAVATYSLNFPDTKVILGDIKNITGKDLLQAGNLSPGELDILDGSPPCSAFSSSGKGKKGWNKDKKYSDGKTVTNIEDLFLEYIRIATDIQPKIIVAENVEGITSRAAIEKLREFVTGFERISPGYRMVYRVMDASKFGVPQSRMRTFFVGIRNDVFETLGLQEYELASLIYPQYSTSEGVSIASAIENINNDPEEVQMLLDACENSFQKKFIETMPFNPSKVLKPGPVNGKTSCFNMKRPAPNKPSPTLTQMGQQRSASGVMHYAANRKLTIKEMKRIMSLPDDYQLTGSFDRQAERIGRMVAPKMMSALATSIYENILKPYKEICNDR
jgi:DNA (cytosine-5)-methyltransferase 1